ncbi:MAG: sulfotransferase domain-containing protein [Planctomycetes bacterium]|nr:sulfotransferase domain-containing protein [Planctomycetota bacterium]
MKCATSTLHDQLSRQPGVFMSEPKEPNFFSDEDVWARGLGWYKGLFDSAPDAAVCGESSTHYTKLPTFPMAAVRLHAHLPHARLIYVMRDPIDRLVSHYIHAWSCRELDRPLNEAVHEHDELIAYSCYGMQLQPWLDLFGPQRVLPVFFERLTRRPQEEFERIARFIGCAGPVCWAEDAEPRNVSAKRLRCHPMLETVLDIGVLRSLRRGLLPEGVRDRIKSRWRMEARPELSGEARSHCIERLDPEMRRLGGMLGLSLTCERFREAVLEPHGPPEWVGVPA